MLNQQGVHHACKMKVDGRGREAKGMLEHLTTIKVDEITKKYFTNKNFQALIGGHELGYNTYDTWHKLISLAMNIGKNR